MLNDKSVIISTTSMYSCAISYSGTEFGHLPVLEFSVYIFSTCVTDLA